MKNKILILINPVLPHITSEISEILNININTLKWEKINIINKIDENIKFIIQVKGKLKGFINLSKKNLSENNIVKIIKSDIKFSNFSNNKVINFKINKFINFE